MQFRKEDEKIGVKTTMTKINQTECFRTLPQKDIIYVKTKCFHVYFTLDNFSFSLLFSPQHDA